MIGMVACSYVTNLFFQALLVIIRPSTTSSSPSQTPGSADLLSAVEEKNALQVNLLPHHVCPPGQIVLITWKPINKKVVLITLGHGSL